MGLGIFFGQKSDSFFLIDSQGGSKNSMEKSLWIAGIIIGLSVFGIKAGLASSAIAYDKELPPKRRAKR